MSKGKRDYSGFIIWAALLVMVVRYSGAFVASDVGRVTGWLSDAISVGMAVSGVGMGILDVIGTAYIAEGWRRNLPARGKAWSNRYKTLTAFLIANAIEAVVILTPYTVSRMYQSGITDILARPWAWGWAAMVTIAPLLVIGGVIFANPGVIGIRTDAEQTHEKKEPVVSDAPPPYEITSDAVVDAMVKFEEYDNFAYYCDQCEEGFEKSGQLAAHVRWQHANGKVKAKEMVE